MAMILSRNDDILKNYDFMDSIVTDVKFDTNLLDLLISVDYYWDIQDSRNKGRQLLLRFKNCQSANFALTKRFNTVSKEDLPSYTNSWYTITGFSLTKNCNLFEVEIKTIDNDPKWLFIKCDEIILEDESLS